MLSTGEKALYASTVITVFGPVSCWSKSTELPSLSPCSLAVSCSRIIQPWLYYLTLLSPLSFLSKEIKGPLRVGIVFFSAQF